MIWETEEDNEKAEEQKRVNGSLSNEHKDSIYSENALIHLKTDKTLAS